MTEPTPGQWLRGGRGAAAAAVVLTIAVIASVVFAFHALGARVVLFSGIFGGVGCPGYSELSFQPPSPVRIESPTVAWATGGLRTTDAGAHWQDVSPPALRPDAPTNYSRKFAYPPGFADFYLDADHGWELRTFSSKSTCFDHAVVFTTSDAGLTWQESAPIPLNVGSGLDAAPQLDFIDLQHGWLWIATGPLAMSNPPSAHTDGSLYGTSDGGLHWRLVAANALSNLGIQAASDCGGPVGDIAFQSQTTAWLPISCQTGSQLEVLVSRDGGVTWNRERLPASVTHGSCPCDIQKFAFFDSNHAVITVFGQSKGLNPEFLILATSDAGVTWNALPSTPSTGYSITIAFLAASDWWDVVTAPGWGKGKLARDWLYKTTDGGDTWTLVQQDLPLGWPVEAMVFVDTSHGWAFQAEGAAGPPPFGQGTEVLTTADGGHTWRLVVAEVNP
jgi:photosystem II stability/assembly factor-like uncharacterized protein